MASQAVACFLQFVRKHRKNMIAYTFEVFVTGASFFMSFNSVVVSLCKPLVIFEEKELRMTVMRLNIVFAHYLSTY